MRPMMERKQDGEVLLNGPGISTCSLFLFSAPVSIISLILAWSWSPTIRLPSISRAGSPEVFTVLSPLRAVPRGQSKFRAVLI